MTTIRPNAEPAATTVAAGDIFLIDGATGVRAFAATNVALLDANFNANLNNVNEGFTAVATAAGTTILTVTSTKTQYFTGVTTQIVTLPVVSTLQLGQAFVLRNASTGIVTINSSGGNLVATLAPGASVTLTCVSLTGTTAASWQGGGMGSTSVASGKVLTASNSLTLAGTDGTTMTFPATSATLARTDAGQTFTGTNAFGVLTATSVNGNTITTGTGTLTLGAGKTHVVSNSLTFAGTDGTTQTFQATDTIVGRATTDTLTNKTIAGASNTLTVRAASDVTGTLPVANGGTNYTGTAWTPFTATVTPGSGAITTQASASSFLQIGKLVHVRIAVTISAIGTAAGTVTVNLPTGTLVAQQAILGRESGVSGKVLAGSGGSGASSVLVLNYDNSNPTYTNGMIVSLTGIYEAT